ncbi:MAG: hypothetical protein ABSF18_06985 [Gammaproteobacteria bacterium]
MPSGQDNSIKDTDYNRVLRDILAYSLPNDRSFLSDHKNINEPLYYLLANWMQRDPRFYEKLEKRSVSSIEQILQLINQSLNKEIDKINGQLEQKVKYWENELKTAAEKSQGTIKAHIEEIRSIIRQGNEQKDRVVNNDHELVSKQEKIKQLENRVVQFNQKNDALIKVNTSSGTFISIDFKKLTNTRKQFVAGEKNRVEQEIERIRPMITSSTGQESQTAKNRLHELEDESKYFPDQSSFPLEKTTKKEYELAVRKGNVSEGRHADPQLFRGPTVHVYFNGKEKSQEEWVELLSGNEKLRNAMDYYEVSMADGAKTLLFIALGYVVEPSETNIYFEENEHGVTCVSEAKNYTNNENRNRIPGSIYTAYAFNSKKGEEGFEWVGLTASNQLMYDILTGDIKKYENLTAQQIRDEQRKECISALLLLNNTIVKIGSNLPRYAPELVKGMHDLIDKWKDKPDANLELLTETAKTTKEYIENPTQENAQKFLALAPKIEKEYDASGKMLAYLIVGLFLTLSVLALVFTGGIAEIFLVAMLGEVVAEAIVAITGLAIGIGATAALVVKIDEKRWMTPLFDRVKEVANTVKPTSEASNDSKSGSSPSPSPSPSPKPPGAS